MTKPEKNIKKLDASFIAEEMPIWWKYLIDTCKKVVSAASIQPEISILSESILMEFKKKKNELRIEFLPQGVSCYSVVGGIERNHMVRTLQDISDLISWFKSEC